MNDAAKKENLGESIELDSLPPELDDLEIPIEDLPNSIKWGKWKCLYMPSAGAGTVFWVLIMNSGQNNERFYLCIAKKGSRPRWECTQLLSSTGSELCVTLNNYTVRANANLSDNMKELDINASYTNPAGKTFKIPKAYTVE